MRRPKDKLLKQTGGEDRPVQYNSEERLLAAGVDIYFAPFKRKCGRGSARQRVNGVGSCP